LPGFFHFDSEDFFALDAVCVAAVDFACVDFAAVVGVDCVVLSVDCVAVAAVHMNVDFVGVDSDYFWNLMIVVSRPLGEVLVLAHSC